jgi:Domain of unknown function (DUF397)
LEPPRPTALAWIKSSRCNATTACVELAVAGDMIAVRSSLRPDAHIYYTPAEISAWIDGAKRGEFDHLVGN